MTSDELSWVTGLERELLTQAVRASVGRIDALLSDDFEEFGASGYVFGKAEVLARLPGEAGISFEIDDFAARKMADGVVLVTYRARRDAEGATRRSLRSSLWKRNTVGWQLVFHHGTALPDDNQPRGVRE